nr:MAG TPA: hypothetical protein [Caudoviricetes sp.]
MVPLENMTNEFILQDRLQKIRQIINQYGEDNFYIRKERKQSLH